MYVLLKILFTKNSNVTRTWIFNEVDARRYMENLPNNIGETVHIVTEFSPEITIIQTATKIS